MCLTPLLMTFKVISGNSSVQDLVPEKGYPMCFASDVGPDLFCRTNFKSNESLSSRQLCAENHWS